MARSEKRHIFSSTSRILRRVLIVRGTAVLWGFLMFFLHGMPAAHADCTFDGSCSGGSGISVPGLGPGTPGYQNYNPAPVCVSNCGSPPAQSAPSAPATRSAPSRSYSRPSTSFPALTPMQSFQMGVVGGVVGGVIEDMFSGPSAADKQKAMQLKQEQERQRLIQEEQAHEAAVKAAAARAEAKRLKEEAFLKNKSNLEQSMSGIQNSLGGYDPNVVDLSHATKFYVDPNNPQLGGTGTKPGVYNSIKPPSGAGNETGQTGTPQSLKSSNGQLLYQENKLDNIQVPAPQPPAESWYDKMQKALTPPAQENEPNMPVGAPRG